MTREEELDAMEYGELSKLFIKGLRKIANEGADRGLTVDESLAEYPFIAEAMAEIERISMCSVEELQSIGICTYCDKLVLKTDLHYVNETVILHEDCKNDVMAEIQSARGEW